MFVSVSEALQPVFADPVYVAAFQLRAMDSDTAQKVTFIKRFIFVLHYLECISSSWNIQYQFLFLSCARVSSLCRGEKGESLSKCRNLAVIFFLHNLHSSVFRLNIQCR